MDALMNKRAQSTLEYIIIFTVIVAGILIAANTLVRGRVSNMLDHASDEAQQAVNKINF